MRTGVLNAVDGSFCGVSRSAHHVAVHVECGPCTLPKFNDALTSRDLQGYRTCATLFHLRNVWMYSCPSFSKLFQWVCPSPGRWVHIFLVPGAPTAPEKISAFYVSTPIPRTWLHRHTLYHIKQSSQVGFQAICFGTLSKLNQGGLSTRRT